MKKRIRFRKLFRVLTERDDGYVGDAICHYQSREHMWQARVLSDSERIEKRYAVEHVVTQYKRYFFLDLWLFTISLTWLSKDISTPNPSLEESIHG